MLIDVKVPLDPEKEEKPYLILFCNQGHSPFPGSGTLRKCYCITFHSITTIYHVTGNTQHRYKNVHHKFCFNPYTMKCSIPLQRKSKPNRNVLPFPSSSKQVLIINKCPTCLPPLTHKKNFALIFSSSYRLTSVKPVIKRFV